MKRFHQASAIWLLAIFGLWGCSKAPTGVSPDRVRVLEEDLKSAQVLRDQLSSKLRSIESNATALEKEVARLQGVVKLTGKERDEALVTVKNRTTERDQLQVQYDGFRRTLKDLIGQAETALKPAGVNPEENVAISGPALFGAAVVPMMK